MTTPPQAPKEVEPPAYWAVKTILGLSIAGLGGLELFSAQSVSPLVYAALAALAGGPEIVGWLRRSDP